MADPAYIVNGTLTDGEAWVAVAQTTLGTDATGVTFTSTDDGQVGDWSQYMDLVLVCYDQSNTEIYSILRFNNDAGTNYTYKMFGGDGSSINTYGGINSSYVHQGYCSKVSDGANVFSVQVTHMFDINSGKFKNTMSQSANDEDGSGYAEINTTIWESQAPITEIDILGWTADWKAGSMFSLFGILPRMVA